MTTKTDEDDVKVGDICVATFGVEILKAEESEDGKTGRVVALVSAYNVEYRMGGFFRPVFHLIEDGGFARSVKAQDAIPLFFQHNWDWSEQPPIGTGVPEEAGRGLQVTGDFFLDVDSGRSVFNAIKAKALREWSIGYMIKRFEQENRDDGSILIRVKEAELLEASSVLRGANPKTETLMVARQMPPEIREALDAMASFTATQKEHNEALTSTLGTVAEGLAALENKVGALEDAHAVLVDSLDMDEVLEGAGSGDEVEPASVGDGEAPEDAAPPSVVPVGETSGRDSSSLPSPESTDEIDLDELLERAEQTARRQREEAVNAQKQQIVDRAGRLLPGDDESIRDMDSLTRVMSVQNKAKHLWESTERRTEVEALAAGRRDEM